MAGFIDSLRSLGRRVSSSLSQATAYLSEGVSRSIASFGERVQRNNLHVRQERGWAPATGQRDQRHRTGERAFSTMMRGAGGINWPGSWFSDRSKQVLYWRRWVYVAGDRICSKIASLPPRVGEVHQAGEHAGAPVQKRFSGDLVCKSYAARFRRYQKTLHAIKPHEEVEEVGPDHPLVELLAHPNAWDKSAGQLWYELVLFLLLTGNAYLWVVPDQAFGMPLELWVIPSQWVFGPYLSAAGPKYYKIIPYIGGSGSFDIPADEIIHFQCKSPLSKIDGFAPLQAGAEWVDVAESIDQSRYWEFKNGAQVRGAVEMDPNYQDPDDIDIDAIGAKFLSRYQGERNAGTPLILPPGTKMVPLNIAPADMAWEAGFEQMRDAVLALFAVPKEVAGIVDAGSHTAMWGPLAQFIEHAIVPKLKLIGETLTESLAHRWGDHLRIWWDDPTPPDPTQVNADLALNLDHGLQSINEARAERGLEPVDDPMADELLVAPNLIPLSKLGEKLEQDAKQQEMMAQAKIEQAKNPMGQMPGQSPSQPGSRQGRPQSDEDNEPWMKPQRPMPWNKGTGDKPPSWGKSLANGNGHVATLTRPRVLKIAESTKIIPLPDTRQRNHFECGAAQSAAVGLLRGVGPKTIAGWAKLLGTTIEQSTHPYAIRDAFINFGCQVEARDGMTLEDLAQYIEMEWPVIVCVQDWGQRREPGAEFSYGHWLCVVGIGMGLVLCHDTSLENVEREPGGDVPKSQAEISGNIAVPGLVPIAQAKFLHEWHDEDADGKKFIRFGIAVGPPAPPRRIRKSAPDGRITRDDFGFVSPPEGIFVPSFGQCETCHKWTGKSCMEFAASEEVIAGGACDLYVYGEPIGDAGIGQESGGTTPDEAGYVERPVRCENCARADEDADRCLFYEELNRQNPQRFHLDVVVTPESCCNAQTAKKG